MTDPRLLVPVGDRDIEFPGSHLNRDGKQGRPILAHLDEALTTAAYPSLDDPIDETWMRLDPVTVSDADFALPIVYSTKALMRDTGRDWPLVHMQITDFVHTIGPFKSERFVQAARAHQHRRMSLTLATAADEDTEPRRYRFFDVRFALDVDLRLLRGPAFWLDWIAYPVGERTETAVLVHETLERTT